MAAVSAANEGESEVMVLRGDETLKFTDCVEPAAELEILAVVAGGNS